MYVMGLIALVKFLAQSFDHLAWPVITLVYPLYASIRAIESNCNTQSRKWLTYWILFALILLFEVTIVNINQWLPVWHHVKLITTFWLVVPHCDGAFYVYENIVRPCFSVNPTTFVQWFKIRKEEFLNHRIDEFLLLAERYIEENGSQSLEKLIEENGSQSLEKLIEKSPSLYMEHGHVMIENNAETEMAITAKMEVNDMDPNILRIETKVEKENKVAESASGECALDPKKSQKEWTCALCQVTTTGESNLTDHLKGKRHKAMEDERLANMTPTKNKNSSILGTPLNHLPKTGSTKLVSSVRQVANVGVLKGTGGQVEQYNKARNVSVAEVKKHQPSKDSKKAQSTTIAVENVGFKGITGSQGEQMNKKKNKVLKNQSSEPWCDTCKIMCSSQSALASHRYGKKHLNHLKNESMMGTSELWCDTCKIMCSSQSTLTSHRYGKKHLNNLKNESMMGAS